VIPFLRVDSESTGTLLVGLGARVTLIGASGAGKTTVLRGLLGLDRRAAARLHDRPIDRKALQQMIGWVPQGDGVFLDQSVLDNVACPPYAKRVDRSVAMDALDLLALADRAQSPVAHLSLLARRRVALARALASARPVLVVDGDLDATLLPLLPLLLQQVEHVETVVTAGCAVDDWVRAADSVALVADGRIVAQGSLEDLERLPEPAVKGVLSWVT
jgi:ABC-type sulfate/molybdate transport systems ATPase subunit